jgi:hypothetical protein
MNYKKAAEIMHVIALEYAEEYGGVPRCMSKKEDIKRHKNMIKEDVEDLEAIACHLMLGNVKYASKKVSDLDTIVRECVPNDLYVWLMERA